MLWVSRHTFTHHQEAVMKHALRIDDLHVSTFEPEAGQPLSPLSAPQQYFTPNQPATGTDSCWGSWCYPQTLTDPNTTAI
jgi:hypothetical protein